MTLEGRELELDGGLEFVLGLRAILMGKWLGSIDEKDGKTRSKKKSK